MLHSNEQIAKAEATPGGRANPVGDRHFLAGAAGRAERQALVLQGVVGSVVEGEGDRESAVIPHQQLDIFPFAQ